MSQSKPKPQILSQFNPFFCLAVIFISALLIPPSSQAWSQTPIQPATIKYIKTRGPACPKNTSAITISPDQTSYSILFDQALVESNPENLLSHKLCEITIGVVVTGGWRAPIHTLDYRGFTQVEEGTKTAFKAFYYRMNHKDEWVLFKEAAQEFFYPFSENFLSRQKFRMSPRRANQCQTHEEEIKIRLQIVARTRPKHNGFSQLALDSVDGTVKATREDCHCS